MQSRYGKVERKIAYLLNHFPWLKSISKSIYSNLNFWLYKKKYTYQTDFKNLKLTFNGEESFWGYYDKSPINKDKTQILFHSTEFLTSELPSAERSINIVLYDIKREKYIKVGTTNTYNWQQGARLQWLNNNEYIYNINKNGNFQSIIKNIKDIPEKIINFPVYDCYNNYALSLNFSRLLFNRPDYGYRTSSKLDLPLPSFSSDGIFYINLSENTSKLIVSLEELLNIEPKKSMSTKEHWVNHIMISPNGENFVFLYRWINQNRKFDRLFSYNFLNKELKILADDDMVSHYCWITNDKIIAYMNDFKYGNGYYVIDLGTNKRTLIKEISEFGDCHPSFYKDKLVFDTYPNKARLKELLLFNMNDSKIQKIGEFLEPLNYKGECRCDLHPRYVDDELFIDSTHEGRRSLYRLSLI